MKKLLLTAAIVAAGCNMGVYAQQSVEPTVAEICHLTLYGEGVPQFWMDSHADSYHSGDGTQQSPYIITTAKELALLARHVHDGVNTEGVYYELGNDIDLNGKFWFPIGLWSDGLKVKAFFNGIFDGKNHKIYHLNTMELDLMSMGLFGMTQDKAEIRNLIIASGEVIGAQRVGAIVGDNMGLIENCINRAFVGCSMYHCGGIVGANSRNTKRVQTSVIRHCVNYGDIDAGLEWANGMVAGGIAGTNYGRIEECVNMGNLHVTNSAVGGLVGYMEGGWLFNSYSICNLSAGQDQLGGLVASFVGRGNNCEVQNCYFSGKIESLTTDAKKGGLFGVAVFPNQNTLLVKNCYYNSNLFNDSYFGQIQDAFGKFKFEKVQGLMEVDMTNEAFVSALNAGSENPVWVSDVDKVNNGLPMLSFMKDLPSGISQNEAYGDSFAYGLDGAIALCGDFDADDKVVVYAMNGMSVFAGNVEALPLQTFQKGLYVVRVGDKSYKVVVR